MKNAILIVNYNDYESTIKLIENIKNYNIFDLILIVDNNSTDSSFNKLKNYENTKIKVINTNNNLGYSYAINYGCKYLIDKLKKCKIIISNSDIVIKSEKDIIKLYSYLHDDILVVGPTIIQKDSISRGWKIPTFKDDLHMNNPFNYQKYEKKHLLYPDEHYKNNYSIVDTVSGCFFLFSSDTFTKIGGMDDNVFLYYEENILGKKIKKINGKIIVVNNINIIHNHSISVNKSLKRIKKYDELKKSQIYFNKNYNNISHFQTFILKCSIKMTRFILIIKYIIDKIR